MTKQWVNWHNHTHGSLLDGFSRPKEYAKRAKELGQPAICATEHGNLYSLLDMYDAAQEEGLKFFPGEEFYFARKTRFDQDEEERAGQATSEWDQRGPYHLGVIAYNNVGYHNLIKLSSLAFLEGYYVKPRIDYELMETYSEGLVVLSGCLSGEVQQAILRGDFNYAIEAAARMQDIVGRENYFIELQNHGIDEEAQCWDALIEIAHKINAPILVTQDSHYTHQHDAGPHDISLCINTGSRIDDENRFKFTGDQFYLKTYDEMVSLFDNEEYVKNTMLIYDKFDIKLEFGQSHFPKYSLPPGKTAEEVLDEWLDEGAQMRFGANWRQNSQVSERLEYETKVIKNMEFTDYFLVISDIIRWAKNQGILVGPSRGSVGGSLVAFCLQITEIDPLKYGLIFERFLIDGRRSPPDADLDFDTRFRDQVVQFAKQKYGHDHTCNIGTMGSIKAKKAVRDVARVLNKPYELGSDLSNAMPPAIYGEPVPLEKCLETERFRNLYETNEDAKEVVDTALKIEGLWRDVGMHPAGLVIADAPVIEYVPVSQKGPDAPIISQWPMTRIDQLGLLKGDFLGVRNLDIIKMTLDTLRQTRGIDIQDPYSLVDDPHAQEVVFAALARGDVVGSFQLESSGIRELAMQVKPQTFGEIADILALYRPGPMESNVHNEYVARKWGRREIQYKHPSLEPILKETKGLLIYQEQVLKIATDVAGFSIPDADGLRKAVGKKKPEEMAKWQKAFIQGCVDTVGMNRRLATELWNEIEHHAAYSFNKGHSYGYGFLSFVTTYLHAEYPAEYYAATLTSLSDDPDRLRLYLAECQRIGIDVKLPSIGKSDRYFKVTGENEIYYSLLGIKGLSDNSIDPILDSEVEFDNFYDFCRNIDISVLNKKIICHLLSGGAFDELLERVEVLDSVDELTQDQYLKLLLEEFEELNLFISGHPFAEMAEQAKTPFMPIRQVFYTESKQTITVAGIITDITRKTTRAGRIMYKLIIQDENDSLLVDVMPRIAEGLGEDKPFQKGDFLVVKGFVDRFGDDAENSVVSLSMIEHEKISISDQFAAIRLQTSTCTASKLNKLIQFLDECKPGDIPVYLEYYDDLNRSNIEIRFDKHIAKKSEIEPILNQILMEI